MKPGISFLHLLNVRASEWNLVRRLFIFEFFQGAGLAFFFTASISLFLDNFSVEELPKVYIFSAFLLWVAGYVYAKLEAKLKIITLARVITIFMAASCLLFRLSVEFLPSYFLYLMLAFFNVLYLLNNLEFWGISSLLFDVRQSKRLFGIISAGDIPAKFIGYSLALVLVSYIGTANLLLAGMFCMVASLPFLNHIRQSENIKKHDHHHHKHNAVRQVVNKHAHVGHLVKNFSVNALIRRIAIVTVIASCVFIVANFAFYAKVKEAFNSDVGLAQFIAMFFAVVRVAAMLVKIIFTGRLINRMGTIKSLLITPVLMILLAVSVLVLEYYARGQNAILYLFGVMAILVDILRTSVNTPVFLTLMQPLSTHDRLRAHTITKGIMDPFAYLFTGVFLLVLFRFDHSSHIQSINILLMVLGALWIFGIFRINHQYIKTLIKTIGNRFFNNSEFSYSDSFTLHYLKQKMAEGNEAEAFNILRMVSINHSAVTEEIILSALSHPSDNVKTQAVELIEQKNMTEAGVILKYILDTTSDTTLKATTISALCRINMKDDLMMDFTDNQHDKIQMAALAGLLRYGNITGSGHAKGRLHDMIRSSRWEERMKAAHVLQDLQDPEYFEEINMLMNDVNNDVKKQAFAAASGTADPALLGKVISYIHINEKMVLQALLHAGANSLPVMYEFMVSQNSNNQQNEKLIRLIGRIGGSEAQEVLLKVLEALPWYPQLVFKTLYHTNYRISHPYIHLFEGYIKQYFNLSARILYMQKLLSKDQPRYQILSTSLELELVSLRDSLLYIFASLYNREQIKDVRTAFNTGGKEQVANAMEIIEMTVKKETAFLFNTIFEPSELQEKIYALRKLYPMSFFRNVENVLSAILKQEDFMYDKWTTACSLYTTKKQHHHIDNTLISKYIEAEHPLLSEVAKFAI
ncbi:MAG: hypothetical protein H0U44_04260 [Flavisolibacter sp.]|jgi:ATP/ADP translocase|nr:hypothetical protein [Flavisolibacter sp.]